MMFVVSKYAYFAMLFMQTLLEPFAFDLLLFVIF